MRQTAARNPDPTSSDHPYIVRTAGVCGGRARIKDSRIPVSIIAGYIQMGDSLGQIADSYPHIPPSAIEDAVGYYLDHRQEIDAEIEANSLESVLADTGAVLGSDGVIRFSKPTR
ncbi:MAG TPA: DUF433 domain-containing protein [Thermoanaerobaculia bacterium]|nr:DUF433 domain-containing protein [Thermoanaerobaculia bacterium]